MRPSVPPVFVFGTGIIWQSASVSRFSSNPVRNVPRTFPVWIWASRVEFLRDNHFWTALFHSFDVFQSWFRELEKHQRLLALFQSWSALIFPESALFRTEIFSAVSERISPESALLSAGFLVLKYWVFSAEQRWTALIQYWFTLNYFWY